MAHHAMKVERDERNPEERKHDEVRDRQEPFDEPEPLRERRVDHRLDTHRLQEPLRYPCCLAIRDLAASSNDRGENDDQHSDHEQEEP